MNKKSVYDLFNEVDFKVDNYEEIPMNDIEKQRVKRLVERKMKTIQETTLEYDKNIVSKKGEKPKVYKIASIIILAIFILGVSPLGREVMAQIKDKIYFTPSQGITNGEKMSEFFILDEPKRVSIDNESVLIKSVINNGEYISMEMWFEEENEGVLANKSNILKDMLSIKTPLGNILKTYTYGASSGGYYGFSFSTNNEKITSFDLYYRDERIDTIELTEGTFSDNYDEIGGNSIDNGIRIGATSYYEEGQRYFKLWSNLDVEAYDEYSALFFGSNSEIIVTDDIGNEIPVEIAEDGTAKSYKVTNNYDGKINILVKEIEVQYNLNDVKEISLKLPKEGESIDINKTVEFPQIEEKILIEKITSGNDEYTIDLNYSIGNNKGIYMVAQNFRDGAGMGDPENKRGEIYIERKDMSFKEKFFNRIYLKLDRIDANIKGNWKFTIE